MIYKITAKLSKVKIMFIPVFWKWENMVFCTIRVHLISAAVHHRLEGKRLNFATWHDHWDLLHLATLGIVMDNNS